MSEEQTQNVPDARSFEERVFARFDAMEARFDAMDTRFNDLDARLQNLETEAERRAFETKPIWERALSEIVEVREGLNEFRGEVNDALRDIARKFGVLSRDMVQLRADQDHLENRLDNLESKS